MKHKCWHDCHGFKCHSLQIMFDGDEELIAYKYWRKHKKRWEYCLEPLWFIEYMQELKEKSNQNKGEDHGCRNNNKV